MNKLQWRGRWHQIRGAVREHWGRLRGNRFQVADAQMERLRGRFQHQHVNLPRSLAGERTRLARLEQRDRHVA